MTGTCSQGDVQREGMELLMVSAEECDEEETDGGGWKTHTLPFFISPPCNQLLKIQYSLSQLNLTSKGITHSTVVLPIAPARHRWPPHQPQK